MRIVIIDSNFQNNEPEHEIFQSAGLEVSYLSGTDEESLKAVGQTADAVLVQFAILSGDILSTWTRCKLIVRYGIGYDNVDVEAATAQGIQVCNVSGYCLDEVADHTAALILGVSRKLLPLHQAIERGEWSFESIVKPMPKLADTQVGIVGFGRIGERVLQRLRPFKFNVKVYDPYLTAEAAKEKQVEKVDDLRTILEQSDIIALHLPLLPTTHHLLNAETLGWMKPTACLVNTSRGALIDTVALANALKAHTIGFAALDVFEQEPLPEQHPLRECGNIWLTPHAAYYSDSSLLELQRSAAEEIVRWVRGEQLHSPVNRLG
jgi:D-3-phosphoglycerate dehydrogenase